MTKAKTNRELLKKVMNQAKSVCSKACKEDWNGTCAMCGKQGTAAHHFFGWKICSNVRFNLDNLVWLCYSCHIHKVHQQGLTEPIRDAIVKRIGTAKFKKLKDKSHLVKKYTVPEVNDIIDEVKKRWNNAE